MPLVSVLMSTLDRGDLLPMAIRSIKKQTYSNWELIIVNDGGQDIGPVVKSFFDKRIKLITFEKNKGKSAAINTAFNTSKGEYISYLDDDDQWLPHHLNTHLAYYLDHPKAQFTHSDTQRVVVQQDRKGHIQEVERHQLYSKPTSFKDLIHKNEITWLSVVHKRECFEKVDGMDERLRALIDYDLWRRMFAHYTPHHIPVHTGDYYIHQQKDGQITGLVAKDPVRYFFYNALIKRKGVPKVMKDAYSMELRQARLTASLDFLKARVEYFHQQGTLERERSCQLLRERLRKKLEAL